MSSQVQGSSWLGGSSFVPQYMVNFCARRRIAISLIGFTGLVVFNVFVQRTIPHDPFQFSNPWVMAATILLATGLAIRSWSAGTLMKSRELTTYGPYALTRNPLYVGSFLMMFGFCILCRDWPTLVFVAGPLVMLYSLQVKFEEQRLSQLFPGAWQNYAATTPRLIPRMIRREAFHGWSASEWLNNREYRGLVATLLGIFAVYAWYEISVRVW